MNCAPELACRPKPLHRRKGSDESTAHETGKDRRRIWIADRVGRKPFVIATFFCFALFPIAVIVASSFSQLVAAFVVGGLREIGEPSRKAMIVDFAAPHLRARSVGLYYLIRSLTVTPAAAVGGLL